MLAGRLYTDATGCRCTFRLRLFNPKGVVDCSPGLFTTLGGSNEISELRSVNAGVLYSIENPKVQEPWAENSVPLWGTSPTQRNIKVLVGHNTEELGE